MQFNNPKLRLQYANFIDIGNLKGNLAPSNPCKNSNFFIQIDKNCLRPFINRISMKLCIKYDIPKKIINKANRSIELSKTFGFSVKMKVNTPKCKT